MSAGGRRVGFGRVCPDITVLLNDYDDDPKWVIYSRLTSGSGKAIKTGTYGQQQGKQLRIHLTFTRFHSFYLVSST